jgi:hypothetical protein
MRVRLAVLLHLATMLIAGAGAAAAQPTLYRGEYSLSFLGFSVARANFDSRVDEKSYAIEGAISAAGLAALFYDTSGTMSASGRFSGDATRPGHFRADYVYGEKPTLVDIRFSGGNVTKTTNVPAPKKRSNWVPLGPNDLKAVADPIAAMLIRADSLREVCGRTVKLYDGELRADLTLAFVKTGRVVARGYQGATVTCSVAFNPVAGYRKNRKALEFLRTKGRMMVAFAPLGKSGVYAPIHATVATEIGTITMRARRFEALQ